ncbi:hypothetical protein V6N12_023016 [Hibiscus sabdariffa]|uniref:60S ribosomal protein L27 n=2 Tax=Hibiscus sabdariffa TaxID=183260 RepID=A0ABR2FWI4_9ROSI
MNVVKSEMFCAGTGEADMLDLINGSLWVAWVEKYLLKGLSLWQVTEKVTHSWAWKKIMKLRDDLAYVGDINWKAFVWREPAAVVAMVKFLKPNKAVIVLQGRYAGRKAVIVKSFDEGTRDRPYGHCLVAGIKKYPSKVIRKDSAKKTAKKSRVKCFVKLVNYQHLMPTRYTLDVDLKDVVAVDALQTKDKKVAACKATKERFEERFKTGKNRWFFTKLRF